MTGMKRKTTLPAKDPRKVQQGRETVAQTRMGLPGRASRRPSLVITADRKAVRTFQSSPSSFSQTGAMGRNDWLAQGVGR